jgi:hypothetical protein
MERTLAFEQSIFTRLSLFSACFTVLVRVQVPGSINGIARPSVNVADATIAAVVAAGVAKQWLPSPVCGR